MVCGILIGLGLWGPLPRCTFGAFLWSAPTILLPAVLLIHIRVIPRLYFLPETILDGMEAQRVREL